MLVRNYNPRSKLQEERTYFEIRGEMIMVSNLDLASVLMAKGHKVLGVDEEDPSWLSFQFKATKVAIKDVERYINRKILVRPRDLLDAYRNLKAEVFKHRGKYIPGHKRKQYVDL